MAPLPLPTDIRADYPMLMIDCPFCGLRAESEFSYGGEGGVARPTACETLTDAQWADYLFMRRNPKGVHHEQWRHVNGCGRWFNALRDTVNCRFHATWCMGQSPPGSSAGAAAHTACAAPAGSDGAPS